MGDKRRLRLVFHLLTALAPLIFMSPLDLQEYALPRRMLCAMMLTKP